MDVVAESVIAVHEERERIGGLRFAFEPPELRFFLARFEPLPLPAMSVDGSLRPAAQPAQSSAPH